MKKYIAPGLICILLDDCDVLTTSAEDDNIIGAPDSWFIYGEL